MCNRHQPSTSDEHFYVIHGCTIVHASVIEFVTLKYDYLATTPTKFLMLFFVIPPYTCNAYEWLLAVWKSKPSNESPIKFSIIILHLVHHSQFNVLIKRLTEKVMTELFWPLEFYGMFSSYERQPNLLSSIVLLTGCANYDCSEFPFACFFFAFVPS